MQVAIGSQIEVQRLVEPRFSVTALFPDHAESSAMPAVLSTAFLVALCELACVELIKPEFGEGQGSVGAAMDLAHLAPTPVGFTLTIKAVLLAQDARTASFELEVHDGTELVARGKHVRAKVSWEKLLTRIARKQPS